MTRKDYIKLAAALNLTLSDYTSLIAQRIVEHAALNIADALELDNPRFDRVRFMDAVRGGK